MELQGRYSDRILMEMRRSFLISRQLHFLTFLWSYSVVLVPPMRVRPGPSS